MKKRLNKGRKKERKKERKNERTKERKNEKRRYEKNDLREGYRTLSVLIESVLSTCPVFTDQSIRGKRSLPPYPKQGL